MSKLIKNYWLYYNLFPEAQRPQRFHLRDDQETWSILMLSDSRYGGIVSWG